MPNSGDWVSADFPAMNEQPLEDLFERTEYGSFIIRRTDDYVIEVNPMLFNWRLCVALAEEFGRTYVHGYCYFGTDHTALIRAIVAAMGWDDPLNTDPVGFDKKAY
jgi:hypothetical protein